MDPISCCSIVAAIVPAIRLAAALQRATLEARLESTRSATDLIRLRSSLNDISSNLNKLRPLESSGHGSPLSVVPLSSALQDCRRVLSEFEKELEQQTKKPLSSSIYHQRVYSQRSSNPRPPPSVQSYDSTQDPDPETQPTLRCLCIFKKKHQHSLSNLPECQAVLDYLDPIEIPPRDWAGKSSVLQESVTRGLDKVLEIRKPCLPVLLDDIDVEIIIWSSHSVSTMQSLDPNSAVALETPRPRLDLLGFSSPHGPSFVTVLGQSGNPNNSRQFLSGPLSTTSEEKMRNVPIFIAESAGPSSISWPLSSTFGEKSCSHGPWQELEAQELREHLRRRVHTRRVLSFALLLPGCLAAGTLFGFGMREEGCSGAARLTNDGGLLNRVSGLYTCPSLGAASVAALVYTIVAMIFALWGQKYSDVCGLFALVISVMVGCFAGATYMIESLIVGGYLSLLFSLALEMCWR